MKSSRSVHFEQPKRKTATPPMEVPKVEPKCRSFKGARNNVHWQHPEIPSTITEGHVLELKRNGNSKLLGLNNQKSATDCDKKEVACEQTIKDEEVKISRDRSQSLPTPSHTPFRLLRDRNCFQRFEINHYVEIGCHIRPKLTKLQLSVGATRWQ